MTQISVAAFSDQAWARGKLVAYAAGLELDRQWMLVKKRDMSFVTQRTHPRMSQVTAAFPTVQSQTV